MKSSQMAVVIDHHHEFKPFARRPKCKRKFKLLTFTQADFSVLEFDPTILANSLKQAVVAANIHRSVSTPCLSLDNDETNDMSPKVEIVGGGRAPGVLGLVVESAIGMACGMAPTPVTKGLGGAYYLRNLNGANIALVKPIDVEASAVVGRILTHSSLKCSVLVDETAVREVAAYLLDHDGFAGVPPTALVKISNLVFHANNSMDIASPLPKIASIQRFVDHDFDAGDLGPSRFSVASVHRIGILDIRLLNLDRHAGNILVKKSKHENNANSYGSVAGDSYAVGAAELVPIDHGLCLPELLDDPYFEWLHWPQAALPFSESEADYICRLDPLKDAEILRTELPSLRESSIRILVLCSIFLKLSVDAGLCLADIGDMMTREYYGTEQGPSVLETLCAKATDYMYNGYQESNHTEEENVQDLGMFQFDIEDEENEENCTEMFNNLPKLLQSNCAASNPPKIPIKLPLTRSLSELTHEMLSTLQEDDDNGSRNTFDDDSEDENEDTNKENGKDGSSSTTRSSSDPRIGVLTRSVSFPETKHNKEIGSISFRDMSEEDWELFLENFEKQLPKAFEDRKRVGLKQRLGTSCKF